MKFTGSFDGDWAGCVPSRTSGPDLGGATQILSSVHDGSSETLAARESLLEAIHEMALNSLILVLGPTGVGKTTLRGRIEQLLTTEMLTELRADPGPLPVVSVECIAPESGTFSWRDRFRRLLLQMEEPLVDYKLNPGAPVRIGDRVVKLMLSARAVGSEYHHVVEQALRFRRASGRTD